MKYIFTTILAFFLAFKGYNQAGFSQNAKDYIETSSSKKVNDKDVDVILADPNLKGSPYANQNFIKGEIIDKSIEKKIPRIKALNVNSLFLCDIKSYKHY